MLYWMLIFVFGILIAYNLGGQIKEAVASTSGTDPNYTKAIYHLLNGLAVALMVIALGAIAIAGLKIVEAFLGM